MSEFASTFIAHAALWILLAFSIASWALIVLKALQAMRTGRADRRFERSFQRAADLDAAARLSEGAETDSSRAQVAAAFFGALAHAAHGHEPSPTCKNLCERALAQRIRKARRASEQGLAVLASIGSTAPFVGLFGTVFGIIHALSAISHRASASIDVVAGPIGEALVATGVGIAVAVPAVLAYNFFVRRSKTLSADLDDFANDLLALAEKRDFKLRTEPRPGTVPASATPLRKETAREALA
ncbi:MotA/TolQ/ExbB proton channel family protein [Trinickia acidisoli]|uniref:MotA/TolQ/ExbB proton channel family protein n=1 Tax=Trinickia acidisoli TaxID=2767482 RepID=UPI001A8F1C1F|nr:MotA/TolQ/ExbB proton channel family protein [Trinickia acidisoli]